MPTPTQTYNTHTLDRRDRLTLTPKVGWPDIPPADLSISTRFLSLEIPGRAFCVLSGLTFVRIGTLIYFGDRWDSNPRLLAPWSCRQVQVSEGTAVVIVRLTTYCFLRSTNRLPKLLLFFFHPICCPRATLALPPSSNSDPGSHSGSSSSLSTTV